MPLELLFLLSACSQYLGAALAVTLFPALSAPGVAFWRAFSAAAVLGLVAARSHWRRQDRCQGREGAAPGALSAASKERASILTLAAFGLALSAMNLCFYLAIQRLPLGTAVALEFSGPIAVATLRARNLSGLGAALLAATGVGLLCVHELSYDAAKASLLGVAFALMAAAAWSCYILIGSYVASRSTGVGELAVSLLFGAAFLTPLASEGVVTAVLKPKLLCLGVMTGLLSSAVPYALEQFVLRRASAARFALLLSLLPATATIVGGLVLLQIPTLLESVGIGLVSLAVVLSRHGERATP